MLEEAKQNVPDDLMQLAHTSNGFTARGNSKGGRNAFNKRPRGASNGGPAKRGRYEGGFGGGSGAAPAASGNSWGASGFGSRW